MSGSQPAMRFYPPQVSWFPPPRRTLSSSKKQTMSQTGISSSNSTTSTRTMRLLIVTLTLVALFIMLLNLSFVYTRLSQHHAFTSSSANYAPHNPQEALALGQQQPRRRRRRRPKYWLLGDKHNDDPLSNAKEHDVWSRKNATSHCQSIDSVQQMLECYRVPLAIRLYQALSRLPSHCYTMDSSIKDKDKDNMSKKQYLLHNWTQLQSCLSFTRSPPASIRTIHILGERHSGTKFVMQELQRCFPRTRFALKVHRDWIRSKHFFQPLDFDFGDSSTDFASSVLIAVFRHPLDWVEAMRLKPYHAPWHMDQFVGNSHTNDIVPLDWHDFVTRPWTMPHHPQYDLVTTTTTTMSRMNNNPNNNNNKTTYQSVDPAHCRYSFASSDIVPCLYNPDAALIPPNRIRGFEPIYEMTRDVVPPPLSSKTTRNDDNHNHQGPRPPFDNILQLRAEKIWHLAVELPLLVPNLGGYLPVRYEDLMTQGTRPLIDWVAQHLQLEPVCATPTGPQSSAHVRQEGMSPAYRAWLEAHLHRPTEALLGYYPPLERKEESTAS